MTRRWLDQVRSLARDALPEPVFRYVEEGAREEITLREAEAAWQAVRVLPRVFQDVRTVETATELMGRPFALPFGIAPMTLQRAADPEGEVAMARAAAGAGVPLVVSSNAGRTFSDIAGTGVTWWVQAYLAADRTSSLPLLRAAVDAGAAAVVLTADAPVLGTRYRLPEGPWVWEMAEPDWVGANAAVPPAGVEPAVRDKAMDLGPADIAWLRKVTGLPVAVKGVQRAEDAQRCAAAGAAAVWVSNHGGRQLDQAMATARCVSAVRAGTGPEVEVYVDGGVRSGLHVLLALALGADAAFVGRPMFHALAAAGADGVARALAELAAELVEAMRLAGCPTRASARGIASPDRGFAPESAPDLREPPV